MATTKSSAEKARRQQFPATVGAADVEVDERSTDGSDGSRYVKEFVVLKANWYPDSEAATHAATAAVVAGEAIQRGLHPRGVATFDGAEDHVDGHSLTLTYSVAVVPSSIDVNAQDTTTPRDISQGTV